MKNFYLFRPGHLFCVQYVDSKDNTRQQSLHCKKKSEALIAFREFEETYKTAATNYSLGFFSKYRETEDGVLSVSAPPSEQIFS